MYISLGCTGDSEIFARILFSRIALNDILVICKIRDYNARFTYINKPQSCFAISRGVYFHVTSKFRENKVLAKISEFTVYL